jgi:N-acetylglucosaminyldiphosphoundecaprenol N-acetyl-beta-D-mannosaminyltransferase
MFLKVLSSGSAMRVSGATSSAPQREPEPSGPALAELLTAVGLPPADELHPAGRSDSITLRSTRRFEGAARARATWRRFGLDEGEYALVVLRRSNGADGAAELERIARALTGRSGTDTVIFPVDAQTRARLAASGRLETLMAAGVRCIEPLRYLDLLSLKAGAGAVLTDSGRAVDEARALGVPHFLVPSGAASVVSPVEALPAPPAPALPPRDMQRVLGVEIDNLDMAQTVARVEQIIDAGGEPAQHVCVNVAKLMSMRDDPELRRIVAGCDLVSADGQPIVWASRLLGTPLPERVAGVDLMLGLLDLAARRGFRPYFLGARPEVLDEAMRRLAAQHPGLEMAGWQDGYFSEDEEAAVCANIRATRPDMLFVAMGSPKKEYFLAAHVDSLGVPFVMGVGGALDVAAGKARRAPVTWQRLGLEWLYRLLQEPRRLGRRYLTTNAGFVAVVARELVRRRSGPRAE